MVAAESSGLMKDVTEKDAEKRHNRIAPWFERVAAETAARPAVLT
jgi:hypothetical protein